MCGICGAIELTGRSIDSDSLRKMCRALIHRGPDDEGIYLEREIGLGVRRLAIIDLKGGHQPVHNEDESMRLIFNGEIYNYKELRQSLEARGHRFYTSSDTETIIHSYEEYGKDCVKYLNGMFAFAIWNKNKQSLFLARDRLGIKPLYYYHSNGKFVFASEIKSILQYPGITREIHIPSLHNYLTYQYIPSPYTIFKGIRKLSPGHILTYQNGEISIEQYWDIGLDQAREEREEYYVEKIMDILRDSIKMRLRSDVPFGAFLSGGIDSSAVVALMSGLMGEPIKTFSMGFNESSFSELKYARLIADRFGTKHHEFIVKPPNAINLLSEIIHHFDEPFGDSSAIPTFMLARLARKEVTVVLSGDGGDELFAGYERYLAAKLMRYYVRLPMLFRERIISPLVEAMPEGSSIHDFRRELRKFICTGSSSPAGRYIRWMSTIDEEMKANLYSGELKASLRSIDLKDPLSGYFYRDQSRDFLRQLLYVDAKTYLPGDLLTKVDRMSMANSLEVRVPLLDHRMVEFAFSIPTSLKLKGITTKYIFKKAFSKLLPRPIIHHRKHGFGVPIGKWFREELKDWSRDILLGEKALNRGYFNTKFLRHLLDEHQKGRRDHGHRIWSLLVLELWHQKYIDKS